MPRKKTTRTSNGSGSIYYSETKEVYVGVIQWTDSNGNKHKKQFSGKKKSGVQSKMEDFKRELLLSRGDLSSESIQFKEYADNWLKTILKMKLKPSSYDRKVVTLERQVYPHIGEIPIEDLSNQDIQNMVSALVDEGLSYSTIKKAVEAVSGCMREYRSKTKSTNNPTEGVSLPEASKKDTSDIKWLNKEQREAVVSAALAKYSNGAPVYRLGNYVPALMYTGMRMGELLALTWDDVDFKEKTVSITKNVVVVKNREKSGAKYVALTQDSTKKKSSTRIIPLSQKALDAFQGLYDVRVGDKYVMASENGTPVNPRNLTRSFNRIMVRAGLANMFESANSKKNSEDSFAALHILRHTFASMLFQNGCSVRIVADLLGHKDTSITENTYIHLIQEQKIKAIENLDTYID